MMDFGGGDPWANKRRKLARTPENQRRSILWSENVGIGKQREAYEEGN
jgi:hypothetical protein